MTPFVFEQQRTRSWDTLADDLLGAFRSLLDALGQGRPVVVVLREGDLAGQGDPAAAAYAHALLGLVRALTVEGGRDSWIINAVSVEGEHAAPQLWIDHLADPGGPRGALVRLGRTHLGRIPA